MSNAHDIHTIAEGLSEADVRLLNGTAATGHGFEPLRDAGLLTARWHGEPAVELTPTPLGRAVLAYLEGRSDGDR